MFTRDLAHPICARGRGFNHKLLFQHVFHTQVFYHLGELDEALNYALGAGSLFDVNDTSDYVQTLVGE